MPMEIHLKTGACSEGWVLWSLKSSYSCVGWMQGWCCFYGGNYKTFQVSSWGSCVWGIQDIGKPVALTLTHSKGPSEQSELEHVPQPCWISGRSGWSSSSFYPLSPMRMFVPALCQKSSSSHFFCFGLVTFFSCTLYPKLWNDRYSKPTK